ncbi:hypothetical protein NEISUBOT_03735 [Neisseria subflava NJ9703]|uniref:Uncharacterized protein n=1 Tax=Neisseria subflava NJ9703 TaxID=546268 RepID=A0A9W5ISE6_NEISU|nr:hypothetical protein NEISUBOT_03735 [Neisseria subflava NJ9703]
MIVKTPKSAFDGIVAPNRINYQLFFSITPFRNPAIRELHVKPTVSFPYSQQSQIQIGCFLKFGKSYRKYAMKL